VSEVDPARRQKFITSFMKYVPHVGALGIAYVAHGDDWAELALPPRADLVGFPDLGPDLGIVSNGAVFSLIDTCAGFAVFTRRGNIGHATIDLRLDYVGAPPPGATMTARMECYRLTRRIAFVRGIAHAGDPARPVANATGTFMLGDV